MPSDVENLLHKLDKEQAVLKAETSAILTDHTSEIKTMCEDIKNLNNFVHEKLLGIYFKLGSFSAGIALIITILTLLLKDVL